MIGQFVTPQKTADMANRCAQGRRKSENISEQTAECRSGKERRDDLAAFVSCAECGGGKKHFQEERLRADGTVHAAVDDVDAVPL